MAARETRSIPLKDDLSIDLLPSPGYRFVPTDQELIRYYLRPKLAKRNLPRWNVIEDRDLYKDEEPAEIFGEKLVNEMYFFTPIKRKYQNGKNIDRVIAGKGAWKTQGTKEVYDDLDPSERRLIGLKNVLNFVSNKTPAGDSKNPSWIMHEYTLVDDGRNEDEQRCALCRIKRGRGNTITGTSTGGVGGVSPLRYLVGEDRMEEEEEDNKLAATAALYKMSALAKIRGGEIQPVVVQQLSEGTDSADENSKEASDYDYDNQPEVNAPIPKDKGKVADDSELENNYAASPKRYKRRINDAVRNNLAIKSLNTPNPKADTPKDNSGFVVREPLASAVEPTFDIVSADYNRDIVHKGDPTCKSPKVPLPHLRSDALVKVASPQEEFMRVINESNDKAELAGITFSTKYHSLKKKYEKLQAYYAELESELAKIKKELTDKDLVIDEKDCENKTLRDVLRNEKAGFKRKLEEIQADNEKMIDYLKAQLHKAKTTKYSKLSDLSSQPGPSNNAPRRSPE